MSARASAHTHSDSELLEVADLVLWSRIPTLTAREVAQRKRVSKEFSTWEATFINPIVKARLLNRTHDWFFPVICKTDWTWRGIAHAAAANLASTTLQALPAFQISPSMYPGHAIIACAGGLLLIKLQAANPITGWHPLIVCNPFTKKWRMLPEANFGVSWDYSGVQAHLDVAEEANTYTVILLFDHGVSFYESKSNLWIFNPFPTNAGTLEKTGPAVAPWPVSMFITTNGGIWGKTGPAVAPWGFVCPSVCVGKRVYTADIEMFGRIEPLIDPSYARDKLYAGHLRIHEINSEAGTWERTNFRLLKSYQNFGDSPLICYKFRKNLGRKSIVFDTAILRYLNLVECGWDLYVIIPARLDEELHHDECCTMYGFDDEDSGCRYPATPLRLQSEGMEWMPLQFHVFQVKQGQRAIVSHAVIRIGVPVSRGDLASRRKALFELTFQSYQPFRNWWSCTAVGSVVWVSVQDYLVEYDVATGSSRTHIISVVDGNSGWGNLDPIWSVDNLGFAYRPSFHMKP